MAWEIRPSVVVHDYVSKKTQKRAYTAAAHHRYINRKEATTYAESFNFWRGKNPWKNAQAMLRKREKRIRRDGRVIDKFTIVFDQRIRQEHAIEATRLTMQRVSEGRARYEFTLHNFGSRAHAHTVTIDENGQPRTIESTNPHAHILYVDEDRKTLKRVFETTGFKSTERFKDIWEASANEVLEKYGYGFRVDRKAWEQLKKERALAELQEQLTAAENDPIPSPDQLHPIPEMALADDTDAVGQVPPDAPTEVLDDRLTPVQESPDTKDAEGGMDHDTYMDAVHEAVHRNRTPEQVQAEGDRARLVDPEAAVGFIGLLQRAKRNARELHDLRAQRSKLTFLQSKADKAAKHAEDARLDATEAENWARNAAYSAEDTATRNAPYLKNGQPKGLKLPESRWLGRLSGWKSATRELSEQKYGQVQGAIHKAEIQKKAAEDHDLEARRLEVLRDEALEKKHAVETQLRQQGTDQELDEAEQLYENHIAEDTFSMTPDELDKALADNLIDAEEYRTMLYLKGEHAHLQAYEERLSQGVRI